MRQIVTWDLSQSSSADMPVCLFEVLRPSLPSGVISSAVSLHNHTFTGQALSSKRLTSIVHLFRQKLTTGLLESAEEREWSQIIFHDQISTKECCRLGGGQTRNLLIETEPPKPVQICLNQQRRHRARLGAVWSGSALLLIQPALFRCTCR